MAITDPVDETAVSVQPLPGFDPSGTVPVSMLRLDKLHPLLSGNKWYKLRHNINDARAAGKTSLLSFGGAYSNHLIAVAAAAYHSGLKSIGFVRGQEHGPDRNRVLQQCADCGMELHFLTREDYARKADTAFMHSLVCRFPEALIIPEGGANESGRNGAGEIAQWISSSFTQVLLSVGTGTTFEGLRNALPQHQHLFGFIPMKGGIYLEEQIRNSLLPEQHANWELTDRFHFGGFGKADEEVKTFMSDFHQQYGFALDRVYTAKMMLGLRYLLQENHFPESAKILCIHTGGLTGN